MPRTFPLSEAQRRADEAQAETGVKHIAVPWEVHGDETLYVVARRIGALGEDHAGH